MRVWHRVQGLLLAKRVTNVLSHCEGQSQLCKNRALLKQKRHIYIYNASGPLEFVETDISRTISKIRKENDT